MVKSILRTLLATCLTSAHFVRAADYGVGFDLSLDYGVASIYFANGSTVDIAKIEGGPAYKQMMRTPEVLQDGHATTADPAAAQAPLGLQSLRDYLPPWLGGNHNDTRSSLSLPLSRMLKALKTATESYLEVDSVSAAEVVVPFPVSESYRDALRSACSSLSLDMPMSAQLPAGILAARAHGIGGKCISDDAWFWERKSQGEEDDDDPAQLILTVDYTRAALTALVVFEDCGVFEHRGVLHDTRLGADGLGLSSNSSRDDLARALRDLTRLPLEDDGNGVELKSISDVVLLGESAGAPRLHDVLKEVLGEQLVTTINDGRNTGVIDPLFAASRGLAWDCWDRMNFNSRQ